MTVYHTTGPMIPASQDQAPTFLSVRRSVLGYNNVDMTASRDGGSGYRVQTRPPDTAHTSAQRRRSCDHAYSPRVPHTPSGVLTGLSVRMAAGPNGVSVHCGVIGWRHLLHDGVVSPTPVADWRSSPGSRPPART